MSEQKQDWIAIIYIASGSSHGRSSDKEKAIKSALHFFHDWESMFQIPAQEVQIEVWDVRGYGEVMWGPCGEVWGINEVTGVREKISASRKPEVVTRLFKPKRKKAA